MTLAFAKYVGSGNDFILIDHRIPFLPLENSLMIEQLCCRHRGVGADGMILLEKSENADFKMRIFNSDGFETEMCGNGLRCLSQYLWDHEITTKKELIIEVIDQLFEVKSIKREVVSISAPPVKKMEWDISLNIEEENYCLHYLNTGVPHLVLFVEDIKNYPLIEKAPFLRHHDRFSPEGVNVNIAEIVDDYTVKMRTFEKGVENETLSCGTGAMAVALALHRGKIATKKITVHPASSEPLTIEQQLKTNRLILQGNAYKVFQGEVTPWQ